MYMFMGYGMLYGIWYGMLYGMVMVWVMGIHIIIKSVDAYDTTRAGQFSIKLYLYNRIGTLSKLCSSK